MVSVSMLPEVEYEHEVEMMDQKKQVMRQILSGQRGLSLIELMIAMALGLLVMAAVIQLFIGSRQTYSATEAVARVQENGRFAMEFVKPDLRAANNSGFCAGNINITNHLDIPDSEAFNLFNTNWTINGWEYDGSGFRGNGITVDNLTPPNDLSNWKGVSPLPAALQGRIVPGSDVLMIRRLERIGGITGDGVNNPQQNNIGTNAPSSGTGIPQCTILLVTNCASGADLFQKVNNANSANLGHGSGCQNPGPGNQTGNQAPDWSTSYSDDMQVYLPRQTFYYIGFNADRGEPGLYRLDMSRGIANPLFEELVEGVENMQVVYGISYPADWTPPGNGQSVNEWRMADEISNWDLVIAVRVAMLVRSPDGIGTRGIERTFDLTGTEVTTATDARLREVFTSTVALRNRLLVN